MKATLSFSLFLALFLVQPAFAQPAGKSSSVDRQEVKPLCIIAGHLFDGTSDSLREKSFIVIQAGCRNSLEQCLSGSVCHSWRCMESFSLFFLLR